MNWTDIAAIVFASVTANHLGLIKAVIAVFFKKRQKLPIVSCPRCLTFWGVTAYGLACFLTGNAAGPSGDGAIATLPSVLPRLLAISLLCSYIAIWLELIEGLIDKLYDHIYEQIYPTADTAADDAPGA